MKFLKTALTRQLSEAIRIELWGEDVILNSKNEYNRARISRLTLNKDDQEQQQRKNKDQDQEYEDTQQWEKEKSGTRRVKELRGCIDLEEGVSRSPARKRIGGEQNQ